MTVMPINTSLLRQDAKKRGDAWSGPDYLASAVPPVLNALVDADARVRYYACEALYNIAKARPTPCLFPGRHLTTILGSHASVLSHTRCTPGLSL